MKIRFAFFIASLRQEKYQRAHCTPHKDFERSRVTLSAAKALIYLLEFFNRSLCLTLFKRQHFPVRFDIIANDPQCAFQLSMDRIAHARESELLYKQFKQTAFFSSDILP